jgi:hypothetical protein
LLRVLLGVFVTWQLVFLLTSNFLPFFLRALTNSQDDFPDQPAPKQNGQGPGRVYDLAVGVNAIADRWAEATGQLQGGVQGWSLYAPSVPEHAVFLEVDVKWHSSGGPRVLQLRARHEPENPLHYFQPFGTFREPAYEASLGLVLWSWDATTAEPEVWRQRIERYVRREFRAIQAYLFWRLHAARDGAPDREGVEELILLGRSYRIPPPGREPWSWDAPVEQPLARWLAAPVPPGYRPIQSFNPVTGRFAWVPITPGRTPDHERHE